MAGHEHSQQTVLVCLRAAISALLFRRNCLPERAFHKHPYCLDNEGANTTAVLLMERGSSFRADCLLDWLDGPAAEALKAGTLRGVQICISPSSIKRNRVLETYTFAIWNEGHGSTTIDIGQDIAELMNSIDRFCDSLPPLPAERFLSVNLCLDTSGSCSSDFQGFEPWSGKHLAFPESPDYTLKQDRFKSVTTSSHCMALSVSHSRLVGPDTASPNAAPIKPCEYINLLPVTHDLDDLFDAPPQAVVQVEDTEVDVAIVNGTNRTEAETEIFSAKALQIKQALQAMQIDDQYTQGDTQPNTIGTQTQILLDTSHSQAKLVRLKPKTQKMRYTHEGKSKLHQEVNAIAKELGGRTASGQVIMCACGFPKEEGYLLQCHCCETWQHSHCYGFVGERDPRLPREHTCYMCMLPDANKAEALIQLLLPRRALYFILRTGIQTKTAFASDLHIEPPQAKAIMARMQKEGLLVSAINSHKAGFGASGKPSYVPAQWGMYEKALDKYFDPTTFVEDYFEDYPLKPSAMSTYLKFKDVQAFPPAVIPKHVKDAEGSRTPTAKKRKRDEAGSAQATPINKRGRVLQAKPINLGSKSSPTHLVLGTTKLLDVAEQANSA